MGTNYFMKEIPRYGGEPLVFHIGKLSAGWSFMWHAHPKEGLFCKGDYMFRLGWREVEIYDDESCENAPIKKSEFWEMVEKAAAATNKRAWREDTSQPGWIDQFDESFFVGDFS